MLMVLIADKGGVKMPFVYMMFSVLSWSLFPLMSAWGIQQLSIFVFIFGTYIVGFVTAGIAFCALPQRQRINLPKISKINQKTFTEIFIGCLAVLLSFACLLISFSYMSRASATVTFEAWPAIAIYLAPILIKSSWEKVSRRDLLFSLLALTGIIFLLVPQARYLSLNHLFLPLVGGILMAVASVIKSRISRGLENKNYPVASLLKTQMLFSAGVILLSIPFVLLWPDKHSVFTPENIMAVVFTGVAIHTLGNISYTMAILRSAKSNIIVLWCLMPVFAVLWLWLAGQTTITPSIVLGAIFITTASMMMTVKADRSLSYTATVVAILVCGSYVYFFSGLGMDDYYQAISVPLFFYAILVAFMMDRLIKSDGLEEQMAVEIMNYIDENVAKMGNDAATYREHILGMVTTNDIAQVNNHYRAVRNNTSKHLSGIYNQLDQLVLSKVRGTNFSEMFVIFIVGALTVFSSVVYRPDNLIADGFAVVVPLSVIFIFFTVLDLSENRRHFFLRRNKEGVMALTQQVTIDLLSERIIAAILIVAILAAFSGLLMLKHAVHT